MFSSERVRQGEAEEPGPEPEPAPTPTRRLVPLQSLPGPPDVGRPRAWLPPPPPQNPPPPPPETKPPQPARVVRDELTEDERRHVERALSESLDAAELLTAPMQRRVRVAPQALLPQPGPH